ncbi:GIY-YIG nuclease family protein [Neisseria sp. S1]|uniref:GIY-YIG nuclease family protein n=1 Tax=Neisseria sp. S1 TaxID=3318354 RepID=UPI003A889D56
MNHIRSLPLPILVPSGGQWCVYLLLCRNGALYCGISNRPAARFNAHLSGKGARFTRINPPVSMRLVYSGLSRNEACRLEPRIKKLTSEQKRILWHSLQEYLPQTASS